MDKQVTNSTVTTTTQNNDPKDKYTFVRGDKYTFMSDNQSDSYVCIIESPDGTVRMIRENRWTTKKEMHEYAKNVRR